MVARLRAQSDGTVLNRFPYHFLLDRIHGELTKDTWDILNGTWTCDHLRHSLAEAGADGYLGQVKGRQSASNDRCDGWTHLSKQQQVPGPRPQSIKQRFQGFCRITL